MDRESYLEELQKVFAIGVATCDSTEDGFIKLEFSKEECEVLADVLCTYKTPVTLKEVVAEKFPYRVSDDFEGGVLGCPSGYGFLGLLRCDCFTDCAVCWNQIAKNTNIYDNRS